MSVRVNANSMPLEIDDRVVATARFSEHAAADGNGAWIGSAYGARLFTCNQAVAALSLARRLCQRRSNTGSGAVSVTVPAYVAL